MHCIFQSMNGLNTPQKIFYGWCDYRVVTTLRFWLATNGAGAGVARSSGSPCLRFLFLQFFVMFFHDTNFVIALLGNNFLEVWRYTGISLSGVRPLVRPLFRQTPPTVMFRFFQNFTIYHWNDMYVSWCDFPALIFRVIPLFVVLTVSPFQANSPHSCVQIFSKHFIIRPSTICRHAPKLCSGFKKPNNTVSCRCAMPISYGVTQDDCTASDRLLDIIYFLCIKFRLNVYMFYLPSPANKS